MDTPTTSSKPLLNVHISSPEKIMFEGQVEAVTSVNDKGEFDLLPLHENFICIIKKKAVIHYKIGGEKKEFAMASGVLKIQKNKVYILTGFEDLGEVIAENVPGQTAHPAQPTTVTPPSGQ
jgi:F-type H+-transporting ATPase subunit epsilon